MSKHTVNYYCAIYVDILGQKEELSKITSFPTSDDEKKVFWGRLSKTAGKVKALRDDFDGFIKKFTAETTLDLSSLPKEKQLLFEEMRKTHFKAMRFSDTVVMYFTLNKEVNITPLSSLSLALTTMASIMFLSLQSKTPLRGAISVGIGMEIDGDGIYGHILNELHHLESKVAQYPRIVISGKIIEFLEYYETLYEDKDNDISKVEKDHIPLIYELIKVDTDENFILNYMNQPTKEALGKDAVSKIYQNICDFIEEELAKFKLQSNEEGNKLFERYKKLQKYIKRNKSNWIR